MVDWLALEGVDGALLQGEEGDACDIGIDAALAIKENSSSCETQLPAINEEIFGSTRAAG